MTKPESEAQLRKFMDSISNEEIIHWFLTSDEALEMIKYKSVRNER